MKVKNKKRKESLKKRKWNGGNSNEMTLSLRASYH